LGRVGWHVELALADESGGEIAESPVRAGVLSATARHIQGVNIRTNALYRGPLVFESDIRTCLGELAVECLLQALADNLRGFCIVLATFQPRLGVLQQILLAFGTNNSVATLRTMFGTGLSVSRNDYCTALVRQIVASEVERRRSTEIEIFLHDPHAAVAWIRAIKHLSPDRPSQIVSVSGYRIRQRFDANHVESMVRHSAGDSVVVAFSWRAVYILAGSNLVSIELLSQHERRCCCEKCCGAEEHDVGKSMFSYVCETDDIVFDFLGTVFVVPVSTVLRLSLAFTGKPSLIN
jgi:hypothetical protein